MNLKIFSQLGFLPAVRTLFKQLSVPVNYVADEPTTAQEILKDTYKDNDAFQLMEDVFFVGMVDDAAFRGNASPTADKIKSDYDGILIFGITLKARPNALLPTRSQLAEIARAFNREYYYTPVVVVFQYGKHLAFANTERLKYRQEWREGEKAGKVSLLRDVHIEKTHSGHERILTELKIPVSGRNRIDSFAGLYKYWQEVFSVSILNKKFYQELSNWYFWATKHVTFPGAPTLANAHYKNAELDDLLQEHKATNVIRMLTRLLFVWFIKEKKLIPEELFELETLQKEILNGISPYHEMGIFKERNKDSVYYKAILQNLFFATLNCPIEGDSLDKRKRSFRGEGYGTHRGIDYLMRYKQYFKNPNAFLKKLNEVVPFLNGGLFECLDDKFNNVYIDGFSDQMTKGEQLIVPDYLFFGVEEEADLSDVMGIAEAKYKKAAVKGLINILKSYKFTITENTPIEEDIALDPELLGKVFENLLASYNPETKTTARKQTGSFYTPREIVNYMVDESLIAYLKNAIPNWGGLDDETLDKELRVLTSFDSKVPFNDTPDLQKEIITALSTCTILDPACGSGAFPMGILQKMVHILQKLDPDNKGWKEVQLQKAEQDSRAAFAIEDKQAREERLLEINEAFDQSINDPDYARKLFLIENCIYGVDIQPIATQISKLRFFISLVVEQKVSSSKNNFGIRPLPNLETKFVAANTLIGIEKPKAQLSLYDTKEVKALEAELKKVRSKLFSAKSKDTKLKYRQQDSELRNAIAVELKKSGWKSDTAQKLAGWDPYDQNASSPFFDSEWMFDIRDGFDVVIGNPPYGNIFKEKILFDLIEQAYSTAEYKIDSYAVFMERGLELVNAKGYLNFITPYTFLSGAYFTRLRTFVFKNNLERLVVLGKKVFEAAEVDTCISMLGKQNINANPAILDLRIDSSLENLAQMQPDKVSKDLLMKSYKDVICVGKKDEIEIFQSLNDLKQKIGNIIIFYHGIQSRGNGLAISQSKGKCSYPILMGRDFNRYYLNPETRYFDFVPNNIKSGGDLSFHHASPKLIIRTTADRVIATIDYEKYLVLNSVNIGIPTSDKYELETIIAILNSRIIEFWYKMAVQEPGKTFAEVKIVYMKKIPLPEFTSDHEKTLSYLSRMLLFLNSPSNKIHNLIVRILDAVVFNLYFPKHMKERDIDILKFVERDITEVMQGREFEKLPDAVKEKVIEQLHAIWSRPDNEVRKRISLFKERSPEILKPILES